MDCSVRYLNCASRSGCWFLQGLSRFPAGCNPAASATYAPRNPTPGGPAGSTPSPSSGWTTSSTAAASTDRPGARLDQGQQCGPQPRVQVGHPLRPPPGRRARPSGSAEGVQLGHALRHRRLPDPGGPGRQPDPAMAQYLGLGPHEEAGADAHPGAGTAPGTSPPATPRTPPQLAYHNNDSQNAKLRVNPLRALRARRSLTRRFDSGTGHDALACGVGGDVGECVQAGCWRFGGGGPVLVQ